MLDHVSALETIYNDQNKRKYHHHSLETLEAEELLQLCLLQTLNKISWRALKIRALLAAGQICPVPLEEV